MSDSTPIFEVRGLRVAIEGKEILRGVDLTIERGKVHALMGRNGSGKTSLFQILCGVLPPTRGELRLDGRLIGPGEREFRARTGVVFQEPALDPRLSARVNLRLAAELLDEAEVPAVAGHGNFSGGQSLAG